MLHPWAIAVGLLAATLPVLDPLADASQTGAIAPFDSPLCAGPGRGTPGTVAAAGRARTDVADGGNRPAGRCDRETLLWRSSRHAAVGARQDVRIVIVDASQSMAARLGNTELFERARPIAAKQVGYEPGLSANVIIAAAKPRCCFRQGFRQLFSAR